MTVIFVTSPCSYAYGRINLSFVTIILLQGFLFPRNRPVSFQATSWRHHFDSIASRKDPGMGRYSHIYAGRLVYSSVCHHSWSGGRISSSKESFQIWWHSSLFYVSACCTGNSGCNESTTRFVEDLGCGISAVSSEARKGVFLFRQLSVPMQRFNAILVRDSFCTRDTSDLWSSQ